MGFVKFAAFLLLIALPLTSLSIMKFHHHQEDKDYAAGQGGFASLEKEMLSSNNNIGGRKLGVKKEIIELENGKSLLGGGGGFEEKISKIVFSSSSINGENNFNGKKKKKKISRFEIRKKLSSGSSVVYNNADYLTHMHHPPKHN